MVFNQNQFKADVQRVMEVVQADMATVSTGRAKPSLIENITVEAYGSIMKLMELATISAPENNVLIVAPWDKSQLQAIEKGIAASGLNLNPVISNDQIRIVIAALTQERREEMVKAVKQKLESGKEMVRDVRQKFKKEIETQKGKPGISEDHIEQGLEELQKETNASIEKLDAMAKAKEQELMQL